MLAAWGNSTEDDEASEEEGVAVALMARSESDSDDEPLERLAQPKEKVRGLNKAQLKGLLFTETCMLKDVCSYLKRDIRKLEHAKETLKSEKLEVDERPLFCVKTLISLKKP